MKIAVLALCALGAVSVTATVSTTTDRRRRSAAADLFLDIVGERPSGRNNIRSPILPVQLPIQLGGHGGVNLPVLVIPVPVYTNSPDSCSPNQQDGTPSAKPAVKPLPSLQAPLNIPVMQILRDATNIANSSQVTQAIPNLPVVQILQQVIQALSNPQGSTRSSILNNQLLGNSSLVIIAQNESLASNFITRGNRAILVEDKKLQELEGPEQNTTVVDDDVIPFSDGSPPLFETAEELIQSYLRQSAVAPELPAVLPDLDLPDRLPARPLPSPIAMTASPRPDFNRSKMRLDPTMLNSEFLEKYDMQRVQMRGRGSQKNGSRNDRMRQLRPGFNGASATGMRGNPPNFRGNQEQMMQNMRQPVQPALVMMIPDRLPPKPSFGATNPGAPPSRPDFNRPLRLRVDLTVPKSDYTEAYDIQWHTQSNTAKTVIEDGSTTIYRAPTPDGRVQYVQIQAERTEDREEMRRCTLSPLMPTSPTDEAFPGLPALDQFDFVGYTTAEGRPMAERWRRVVTTAPGEGGAAEGEILTFTHEIFIARERGQAIPLRYMVVTDSSVLGPNFDSYTHRYSILPPPTAAMLPDMSKECDTVENFHDPNIEHDHHSHQGQGFRGYDYSIQDNRYDYYDGPRQPGYNYNAARQGYDYNDQGFRGYDYNSQGIRGSDYNSQGNRGYEYNSQGIRGSDYNSQGIRGSDYNSQGNRGYEYNSQGIRGSDYNSQGIRDSDYNSQGNRGYDYNDNGYRPDEPQKWDLTGWPRMVAKFDPIREFAGPTRDIRYDALLEEFKTQYNRTYLDAAEEALRKALLIKSTRFIEAGNRLNSGFKMAPNFLSDRLDEEIEQLFGVQELPEGVSEPNLIPFPYSEDELMDIKLAEEFDWRELGGVSPVRFQQIRCSSCWAFAVAGSTEGALFKKTNKLVPLSPQALVDCGKPFGTKGCKGTWPSLAFEYARARGLPAWDDYPYQAEVQECKDRIVRPVTRISGQVNVTANSEQALKVAIQNHAPSVVIVDSKAKTFIFYESGVLKDKRCGQNKPRLNHAVLAVGWGMKGGPHFILKNTWTTKWGESGYVRVSPDSCAVLERPSYSLIDTCNIDSEDDTTTPKSTSKARNTRMNGKKLGK